MGEGTPEPGSRAALGEVRYGLWSTLWESKFGKGCVQPREVSSWKRRIVGSARELATPQIGWHPGPADFCGRTGPEGTCVVGLAKSGFGGKTLSSD